MALIECYECGKQISDKAPSCPSCGAPAMPPEKKCYECDEVIADETGCP